MATKKEAGKIQKAAEKPAKEKFKKRKGKAEPELAEYFKQESSKETEDWEITEKAMRNHH